MAEVLGVVANVIAVAQACEVIIKVCKSYIEGVQGYPNHLCRILIEVSTSKAVFDNLKFLHDTDREKSPILERLGAADGPVQACYKVISQLQEELPPEFHHEETNGSAASPASVTAQRKRQDLTKAWDRLKWPTKMSKVDALLGELSQYKSTISMAFSSELVQDIKLVKNKLQDISNELDASSKRGFRNWLWQTNPSGLHNEMHELYEPGTGEWVLHLPEWDDWLHQKRRSLWIHGIPGAGKTVLFSNLATVTSAHCDSIQGRRVGYVYYYCYHARNQDEAAPFLLWALGQLSLQADSIPAEIYKIYQNGFEPTFNQLLSAIEQTLESFDVAYLLLDAIDESQPREDLLRVLRDFVTDHRFDKIQLLTTSREYVDIENVMERISSPISMAHPSVQSDIRLLVSRTLLNEIKFSHWTPQLRDEVEEALAEGAQGMFRWAVCQIDLLRRMRRKGANDIRKSLKILPKTLDETYERIFAAIEEEDRAIVRFTLSWIRFNAECDVRSRPVQLATFLLILSRLQLPCGLENPELENDSDGGQWLRDICGCLISVSQESEPTLSLAHYTVREFLTSSRILESPSASFRLDLLGIARQCVSVALQYFEIIGTAENSEVEAYLNTSLPHMVLHLFRSPEWQEVLLLDEALWKNIVLGFLRRNDLYGTLRRCDRDNERYNTRRGRRWNVSGEPPLWTAAKLCEYADEVSDPILVLRLIHLNAYRILDAFLGGKDESEIFRRQVTVIYRHRDNGDETILKGTILDIHLQKPPIKWQNGVGVEEGFSLLFKKAAGSFDPNLVLVAISQIHPRKNHDWIGNTCCVKLLLSQGADPNWGELGLTPLQIAAARLDVAAVEDLLGAGADPNKVGRLIGASPGNCTVDEPRRRRLEGRSPLNICRFKYESDNKVDWMLHKEQVEALLLEAGAEDFEGDLEGELEDQD